jgi:Fe-S cluster biogenesis protein NfuA
MEEYIEIYTESTPNPETLKFVTSKFILKGAVVEFKTKELAAESPIALMLFNMPFVQSVFVAGHVITITKKAEYEWFEISPEIKTALRSFLQSGELPFTKAFFDMQPGESQATQSEMKTVDMQIVDLLEKYVKPAVENDGGHIAFKSFKDGIVTLAMQGSCSGCPSASITLKSGIEGLLKRMIPEVQEVVAHEE